MSESFVAAAEARSSDAVGLKAADDPLVLYMLTTNNVPYRQCASEARALLPPQYARTVLHGAESLRAVTCEAPSSFAGDLAQLTLPERVYAIVCHVPAGALPEDEAQLLPHLKALITSATGWSSALSAHRTIHPGLGELSFGVYAVRRGKRFRDAVSSLGLGRSLGGALNTAFGWRVDLTSPMLEVSVSLNDEALLVSVALLRRLDSLECRTRGGLDPHVAWAMVRTLGPLPAGGLVCDPMCGKGSLLFEALDAHPLCVGVGVDADEGQLARAIANRSAVPRALGDRLTLLRGEACALPLAQCDAIVCDPPFESSSRFGFHLDTSRGASLEAYASEFSRLLRPGGRAVLLMSEERLPALHEALAANGLLVLCVRPCPLGYTKAAITLAEKAREPIDEQGEVQRATASVGALPWEGKGRRAQWTVLRKEGRAPMVPWYRAQTQAATTSKGKA